MTFSPSLLDRLALFTLCVGCAACTPPAETTEPSASPPSAAPSLDPARTVTTESGLQMQDLEEGSGPAVEAGNLAAVHYTGWLTNGVSFDSSRKRNRPFEFKVGNREVIAGWDEGLIGMKMGGKRLLSIPGDLAYGPQGRPGRIPPNATLIFEIELIGIR